jgi:hypothetical protein
MRVADQGRSGGTAGDPDHPQAEPPCGPPRTADDGLAQPAVLGFWGLGATGGRAVPVSWTHRVGQRPVPRWRPASIPVGSAMRVSLGDAWSRHYHGHRPCDRRDERDADGIRRAARDDTAARWHILGDGPIWQRRHQRRTSTIVPEDRKNPTGHDRAPGCCPGYPLEAGLTWRTLGAVRSRAAAIRRGRRCLDRGHGWAQRVGEPLEPLE